MEHQSLQTIIGPWIESQHLQKKLPVICCVLYF